MNLPPAGTERNIAHPVPTRPTCLNERFRATVLTLLLHGPPRPLHGLRDQQRFRSTRPSEPIDDSVLAGGSTERPNAFCFSILRGTPSILHLAASFAPAEARSARHLAYLSRDIGPSDTSERDIFLIDGAAESGKITRMQQVLAHAESPMTAGLQSV
jgi:hypothetical protein